jgi:hypothetical protein
MMEGGIIEKRHRALVGVQVVGILAKDDGGVVNDERPAVDHRCVVKLAEVELLAQGCAGNAAAVLDAERSPAGDVQRRDRPEGALPPADLRVAGDVELKRRWSPEQGRPEAAAQRAVVEREGDGGVGAGGGRVEHELHVAHVEVHIRDRQVVDGQPAVLDRLQKFIHPSHRRGNARPRKGDPGHGFPRDVGIAVVEVGLVGYFEHVAFVGNELKRMGVCAANHADIQVGGSDQGLRVRGAERAERQGGGQSPAWSVQQVEVNRLPAGVAGCRRRQRVGGGKRVHFHVSDSA